MSESRSTSSIQADSGSRSQGPDITGHLDNTEAQWRQLGEIWSRHLATARSQTEKAIEALKQEFADIVLSLDELSITARRLEMSRARLGRGEGGEAEPENPAAVDEIQYCAARLEMEATNIRLNIDAALANLQFQERLEQILGRLEADMHTLPGVIAEIRAGFERTGQLDPVDFTALIAACETDPSASGAASGQEGRPGVREAYELTYF